MEPKIFFTLYPPAIHIEFSALYLPENFRFDPNDVNLVSHLDQKVEILKYVTNHFSEKIKNYDSLVAKAQYLDILLHPKYDRRVYLMGDGVHPCELYLNDLRVKQH